MIQISLKGKGVFYSEWSLLKSDGLIIIDKAAKRKETIEQAWLQADFYSLKLSINTIEKSQNTNLLKAGLLLDTSSLIEIKSNQ
jgi:hypothetical protein